VCCIETTNHLSSPVTLELQSDHLTLNAGQDGTIAVKLTKHSVGGGDSQGETRTANTRFATINIAVTSRPVGGVDEAQVGWDEAVTDLIQLLVRH